MSKLDGRAENPHTTGWYRGDKAATESKAETAAMKVPPSDPGLAKLLEAAKSRVITDEEKRAQRESWVRGLLTPATASRIQRGMAPDIRTALGHDPEMTLPPETEGCTLEEFRRIIVCQRFDSWRGSLEALAANLGITRPTLMKLLFKYGKLKCKKTYKSPPDLH